ncbi:MAG: acetoacetate--CoA ligase [Rhodospirillales bacterium]
MTDSQPLWTPSPERVEASKLRAFMKRMQGHHDAPGDDGYEPFWRWSLDNPALFWNGVVTDVAVMAYEWGENVLADAGKMPGARFYPDGRLSFPQNMLRRRGPEDAIVFWGEDKVKRRLSRDDVYAQVSVLAQAMRRDGVGPGDRVAGFMPNLPETVIACLAAASLGAVWSSCSPDFGAEGVLDRFGQIEPKILFAADGYYYNGQWRETLTKLADITKRLPGLRRVVVCGYAGGAPDLSAAPTVSGAVTLNDYTAAHGAERVIPFEITPFNHPLYILYSSGTTGAPKCIVHGVGGVMVQHLKEHHLHCDIRDGDRVFHFATCGWMMWNWQISAMMLGAALMLYDGSPFYPGPDILWDYAQAENFTLFGTSAKYIDALGKAGAAPVETHNLAALRTITSTGSPLAAEGFDYVYQRVKQDVHLASIAGGTDIIGCFIGGSPVDPVRRGEIQRPMLGMAVDVFDDAGGAVTGAKGELVCTRPFPSMPLGFWNDEGDARYRAAYFEHFKGVWRHGDWLERTKNGGFIMHGRSDATLNPGGVRIGTAEIYRQAEKLPEVKETVVIGQEWDGDVRIVLFVTPAKGVRLDDALKDRIRAEIRANCSPRHVPARIVEVADIPRTRSGKITELTVRDAVHGRAVKNTEALANPEALELFRNRPELAV